MTKSERYEITAGFKMQIITASMNKGLHIQKSKKSIHVELQNIYVDDNFTSLTFISLFSNILQDFFSKAGQCV